MIFVILHNKQMVLINDSLMKRIFFLAVALFVAAISANAQDDETSEDEISLSWGYGTYPHLIEGMNSIVFKVYDLDVKATVSYGSFGVQYIHKFNNLVGVGALASLEHIAKKEEVSLKQYTENFVTVMPTFKATWYRSDDFNLYSRVAAGVAFEMCDIDGKNKSEVQFGFQLTPIALEVGKGKIHGFAELGFGYQGIFSAGISLGL